MIGWPYTRSEPPLEPRDEVPACPTCGGAGELDGDDDWWCPACEKREDEDDDER